MSSVASATVSVMVLLKCTCLPACKASLPCSQCSPIGEAIVTASTSPRANRSSYSTNPCSTPNFSAAASARPGTGSQTAASLTRPVRSGCPKCGRIPRTEMLPAPTTPTRTVSAMHSIVPCGAVPCSSIAARRAASRCRSTRASSSSASLAPFAGSEVVAVGRDAEADTPGDIRRDCDPEEAFRQADIAVRGLTPEDVGDHLEQPDSEVRRVSHAHTGSGEEQHPAGKEPADAIDQCERQCDPGQHEAAFKDNRRHAALEWRRTKADHGLCGQPGQAAGDGEPCGPAR